MVIGLLVLFLGSVTVLAVAVMGLVGKLPRNHWAGIRLPYTMANDERWEATHRFAAPFLIFGAVGAASVTLAFLPFALAGRVSDTLGALVAIITAVVLLTAVVFGALIGVTASKRAGL